MNFNAFDDMANYLYADGDILMTLCRLIVFIFILEAGAHIVSLVTSISKVAVK